MYLEKINSPEDIKKLNIEEMKILAQEIREAIIKIINFTTVFKFTIFIFF